MDPWFFEYGPIDRIGSVDLGWLKGYNKTCRLTLVLLIDCRSPSVSERSIQSVIQLPEC